MKAETKEAGNKSKQTGSNSDGTCHWLQQIT